MKYSISSDFDSANILVLSAEENSATLDVELRDTTEDWFYWCFKVENAGGKCITFNFCNNNRVGYYGAAVSHDYENWHWQYEERGHQGKSFTYNFAENENEVYFAHDMLYRPKKFSDFAKKLGVEIKTFCQTRNSNNVPYIEIGESKETVLLTARHHACESTGNYVLEGVLDELITNRYFEKYRIICVPFVDYDGVVEGDQGKRRAPHDHNQDYKSDISPIYNTTAKIRSLADCMKIKYAFDFHSPWHLGGQNDTVFIPIKRYEDMQVISVFSKILEGKNAADSLPYFECNNFPPNTGWNKLNSSAMAAYFCNKGAALSFTLETPYFFASDVSFSPEKAFNLGKKFAKAIKDYEKMQTNENC